MSHKDTLTALNKLRIKINDTESCARLGKITEQEYAQRLEDIDRELRELEESVPEKVEKKRWWKL